MSESWIPLEIPLRDIFAAVALHASLLSESHCVSAAKTITDEVEHGELDEEDATEAMCAIHAGIAYEIADAMMNRRIDGDVDLEAN